MLIAVQFYMVNGADALPPSSEIMCSHRDSWTALTFFVVYSLGFFIVSSTAVDSLRLSASAAFLKPFSMEMQNNDLAKSNLLS